jgi:hypothetical protein
MSLTTYNGKPVENPTVAPSLPVTVANPTVTAAAAPAKKQTHRPECGDVGVTGEHGDLGSNAA